ncbi:hypothetical protein PUN4_50026 [Paraburkholderia unamae]|nr:hypothetical protein PUN4_50026 [Paraburkholderia unamae]
MCGAPTAALRAGRHFAGVAAGIDFLARRAKLARTLPRPLVARRQNTAVRDQVASCAALSGDHVDRSERMLTISFGMRMIYK